MSNVYSECWESLFIFCHVLVSFYLLQPSYKISGQAEINTGSKIVRPNPCSEFLLLSSSFHCSCDSSCSSKCHNLELVSNNNSLLLNWWSSLHPNFGWFAASWLSAGVVLITVAACSSSLYIDSVEQSKPVKILVPRVAQACRSHSCATCYWLNRRVLGNIEEDKRYTQSDTYIDRLSFRNRSKGGWNGNFFRMGGRGKVYRSKNNNTTFHSRGGENISRGGERPSPPPPLNETLIDTNIPCDVGRCHDQCWARSGSPQLQLHSTAHRIL